MSWATGPLGVPTSARVDIVIADNTTLSEAFQFDPPGPSGIFNGFAFTGPTGPTGVQWGFTGMNFTMDIWGNYGQTGPSFSFSSQPSNSAMILIDDYTNRILHFNVANAIYKGLTAATGATGTGLIAGEYFHQFRMADSSNPPIVTELMHGVLTIRHRV